MQLIYSNHGSCVISQASNAPHVAASLSPTWPRTKLGRWPARTHWISMAVFCLILYWIAIFTATHLPQSLIPVRHSFAGADKLAHALIFFGFAWLMAWAAGVSRHTRRVAWVVGLGAVYAGLDEFTQNWAPGRTADPLDFAADLLGIVLGTSLFVLASSIFRTHKQPANG
ncbi:MAG: hypothetical protein D6753_16465 [Planctomycetota bacterium]|nr:MAG: hypothetical protein D6753_16465 [Planctomycetota bacterium]